VSALILEDIAETGIVAKPSVAVVSVKTSYYSTKRGFATTKRIDFLKRKSDWECVYSIKEDASFCGADAVIGRIINLNDVKDGIYRMIFINEHRDWDSGHIEDWDYKLVPHEETKP
jgi:uncharacterized protein YbjQ (UPF0145 family)